MEIKPYVDTTQAVHKVSTVLIFTPLEIGNDIDTTTFMYEVVPTIISQVSHPGLKYPRVR